jgi:hypothetical protein
VFELDLIEFVVAACLVGAGGCLLYALLAKSADARAGGIVAVVLLLVLAAATAVVDEKVGSGTAHDDGESSNGAQTKGEEVIKYPFEPSELTNFAGRVAFRGRPEAKTLCLVTYYNHAAELGKGRNYKWWTSCEEAGELETISEVRDQLALLPAWGPRDAEAVACVPSGANVAFLQGTVGPQTSDGHTYQGGAIQYRVLRFDTDWINQQRRLPEPPARLPALDPGECGS